MAVADTNYRYLPVGIGGYGKSAVLPFLNNLKYGHKFR
jgi:hypothetical protein